MKVDGKPTHIEYPVVWRIGHCVAGRFNFGQGVYHNLDSDGHEECRGRNAAIASIRLRLLLSMRVLGRSSLCDLLLLVKNANVCVSGLAFDKLTMDLSHRRGRVVR